MRFRCLNIFYFIVFLIIQNLQTDTTHSRTRRWTYSRKHIETNSLTWYLECDVYNWPKRVNTKILIILHVVIWFLCAKDLFYAYYYKRYLIGFKGLLNLNYFTYLCLYLIYIFTSIYIFTNFYHKKRLFVCQIGQCIS